MFRIRYEMPHGTRISETSYETVQEVFNFLLEVGFEAVGGYFTDGETNAYIKETTV
jgi:hypothetical protein